MKIYVITRLKEPSTWRGLIMLATACGMHIAPEQADAIVSFGIAIAGLAGVFVPDALHK